LKASAKIFNNKIALRPTAESVFCKKFIESSEYFTEQKMAIYLIKRHTGATNAEIGEMFGGVCYSAVAKINERFAREMEENRKLRKMTGKIDMELSNVKG
jgi:hypothetical protein